MPAPILEYELRYRRSGISAPWTVRRYPADSNIITINGLERSVAYEGEARSIGPGGMSSAWVPVTFTTADATLVPLPPLTLTAAPVVDGVALKWSVEASQRAGVEYEIQRTSDSAGAPDGAGWATLATVRALAYTDPVTDGVMRWYRVRAINFNDIGSAWSPEASSKPIAIGGNGTNLVWEEYSLLQRAQALSSTSHPACHYVGLSFLQAEPQAVAYGGFEYYAATSTTDTVNSYFRLAASSSDHNIKLVGGRKYLLSYYARSNVVGHQIRPFMRGAVAIDATVQALTDGRVRYACVLDLSASAGGNVHIGFFCNVSGVSGRHVLIDGVMLEPMVGSVSVPSEFVPGSSARQVARKNRIFEGAAQPVAENIGDLWRDTLNQVVKRWDGSAWVFYAADTIKKNLLVNPTGMHDYDGWTGWIGSGRQRMTTRNEAFGKAFACDFADTGSYDMGASQEITGISASTPYTLSLGIYGFHMVSGSVHAQVRFYTSGGAQTGASVTIEADIVNNKLENLWTAMTSPADAVKAVVIIRATGTSGGAGGYFRWWNIKFEQSDFPTPYSDDATPKVSPVDNYLDTSVGGGGRWRLGLRFGASGQRLGDERNTRALVGWNRTNGAAQVSMTSSDAGTTATISIPAHSRYAGFGTTSFPSGTITGRAFSTYYVVYRDTPNYSSSEGAYTTSTDAYIGVKNSDRVVIGGITTVADGGSGGSGGGFETCVAADAWVRPSLRARAVRRGQLLDVTRPAGLGWRVLWWLLGKRLPARADARVVDAPRVAIEAANGCRLQCSHATPFELPGGRVQYAPFMLGEVVLTDRGASRVARVIDLGRGPVARISVWGHSFAAGDQPDARIFSHNDLKP